MNMDTLAAEALGSAMSITGAPNTDEHTQEVAYMLACAIMAELAAEAHTNHTA